MSGEVKAHLQLANFTLGSDATLNTELHKNSVRIKVPKIHELMYFVVVRTELNDQQVN